MSSFDIYVINLDKDTERMKHMEKMLFPNSYTRISGVYGNKQDFSTNDDIYYLSKLYTPKSALGCALSHRKAMNSFLENSKKEYALILEDDAVPNDEKNYIHQIENILKEAPLDWDIIKLDWLVDYVYQFIKPANQKFNQIKTLLLTAYLVNKQSVTKILKHEVFYHYDVDIHLMNLKVYNYHIKIFKQNKEKTISNNHREIKNPILQKILTSNIFNLNYNVVRMGDINFTISDFVFFIFVLLCVIIIKHNWRKMENMVKKTRLTKKWALNEHK